LLKTALYTGLAAIGILAPQVTLASTADPADQSPSMAREVGTPGRDVMIGGSYPDDLHGVGGNDYIRGMKGADVLDGGVGRDKIRDDRGTDRIYLGPGRDTAVLVNDAQYDKLRCGPGVDKVWYRSGFLSMEQQYAWQHGCPWDWQKVPGT
jgi:Ca2+-binding RTX toxin-like protein